MADDSINKQDPTLQNWSYVSETINMLYLAVCQIESTMTEANTSVDVLTQSFTQLAGHTNDVSSQVQCLTEVEQLQRFKEDIAQTANEIQTNINSSIRAFQFYDRVCQRVDHVARSLEKVSAILEDETEMKKPSAWKGIQEQIKSSYTMEAERIMFEYIMRGGTVKEALEIYNHHFSAESDDPGDKDEIELF
ncbi:hypothetical protein TDB9533_03548 [Thalassocella blandensis]|nr:hypothetical protein TDB9533_03548 [Thalassocella blandensis]